MRKSLEGMLLDTRVVKIGLFLTIIWICTGCEIRPAEAQIDRCKTKELKMVDDVELVKLLGSRVRTRSFEAARQIFGRGDRMIPLLVDNKGNSQPYAWGSLGNPKSGSITFAPSSSSEWDNGRIVTVEIASLYLICAIYEQDFEFGQSAYLRSNEEIEFNRYNTTERVKEAWDSIEAWIGKMNIEELATLREKKIRPLGKTKLFF